MEAVQRLDEKQCITGLARSIDGQLLLCYCGVFKDDFSLEAAKEIQKCVNENTGNKTIAKRSFIISIELLQNIQKHAQQVDAPERAYIAVSKEGEGVSIHTQNDVQNVRLSKLIEHIEKINKCSSKELQELYFETLTNGERTKLGGSGLGLIEIARKSQNPIEFEVITNDKDYATLCLTILLKA